MKRQITPFELVRLLLSLLCAAIIFPVASDLGAQWTGDVTGIFSLIIYLVVGITLPAFVAIALSTLLPSWRYEMIAATLMLMGITVWSIWEMVALVSDFWSLAFAIIRLSAALTGALLAIWMWKSWRAKHLQRGQAITSPASPATSEPATSPILLGLSLLSIPLTYVTLFASAFLVIGYSAVLLFLLFEMPRIPVFLLVAAGLAPLVAGWASLRALGAQFFPKPPFQPAHTLQMTQRPLLDKMIKEVCAAVGSREPDNVILHLEPTFFVTQHKMRTFDRMIHGRTLAIGLPLLPLLNRQELKAVLAHEFAHFSGRDTLYSVWVAPVYRSLGESITRLQSTTSSSQSNVQVVMNLLLIPSLLFLIIFYEFFASIEAIVSRSRELRADWIAARHFGSNALIGALQKIVQYTQYFGDEQERANADDASGEKAKVGGTQGKDEIARPYRLLRPVDPALLQGYLEKAMAVQEGEFDSHPTLRTRIGNLPAMEASADEPSEDIQQELQADEAALSAAYTMAVQQVRAMFAQYQQQQSTT